MSNLFGQIVWLLSPELLLLLVGGILVALNALGSRWDLSRWAPYVALAGLLGALVATGSLWGCDEPLLGVLVCDGFALAIKAIVLVAMVIVVLLSSESVRARGGRHDGVFYALLLFATAGVCLMGAAVDLIALVLASELFGISSVLLIGYRKGERRTAEAAVKLFLYSAVASAIMLYGLTWLYGAAGSTGYAAIADSLGGSGQELRPALLPALVLTIAGFAGKVAAVPFHQWLPDVCEGAPGRVVAFFAIGPILAGFAGFTRALPAMLPVDAQALDVDVGTLLSALAALTILVASLVALWQRNMRRLLAYLAIAHVGYLLIGIVVHFGIAQTERALDEVVAVSQGGVAAVLFSLAIYAVSVLGALGAALALSRHTGSDTIESYAGMHARSPELAWPLVLCLLSLVGIPPTAGFVGRLTLFSAAVEAGLLWLAIVAALGMVISLACVWRVARVMFVAPSRAGLDTRERLVVSPLLAGVLGVIVAAVFAAAVFAHPLLTLLQFAAQAVIEWAE